MLLLSCISAVFCRFVISFGTLWSFNVITVFILFCCDDLQYVPKLLEFSPALYGGRSPWPFT